MGRNVVETLMGAVVLLVAATFVFISYKSGNITQAPNGYLVTAKFREVGGLSIGGDVRVGGIKVGTVASQTLDAKNYMAVVGLNLQSDVKLPQDSSAAIVSDGLMGGKYIAIVPGGDEAMLENGSEIKYTQDSISLEQLIGKFAFGGVGDKDKKEEESKSGL